MVKIKKENLEKAFEKDTNDVPKMPKEMEIGLHQGALSTLVNERNELVKLIQNVEGIMQGHIKRLEELGIKIKTAKQ